MQRSVAALVVALLGGCGYPELPRLLDANTASDAPAEPADAPVVPPDGAPHDTASSDATASDAAAPDGGGQGPDGGTTGPVCRTTCGPTASDDCCATRLVPGNATGATLAGDVFYRTYDAAPDANNLTTYPATVSDFRLDTYEVTVARFRAFVDAGLGTQANPPAPGAGAHPRVANSGWNPAWTTELAVSTAALQAALVCAPTIYSTWTNTIGPHDDRPANCVSWYEAFAFCAWDGGRLPTDAEWNYAAVGGSEHRAYPWSTPADSLTITEDHASFSLGGVAACRGDGVDGCAVTDLLHVGSKPAGNGRWGHADLGGNVWEWTLDAALSLTAPCDDCANVATWPSHFTRGGAFNNAVADLRSAARTNVWSANVHHAATGFRCARAP